MNPQRPPNESDGDFPNWYRFSDNEETRRQERLENKQHLSSIGELQQQRMERLLRGDPSA